MYTEKHMYQEQAPIEKNTEKGPVAPVTFADIIHDERLLRAIADLGFTEPTEIQALTIPPGLKGRDLIGQAKTGSGKTLAFGIPLLKTITQERRPQALILAPTRELCQQIAKELGKLARHASIKIAAVFGGVGYSPQVEALKTAQVVVATPGRLLDHLTQRTFATGSIRFLVFDEADRMFDMGFIRDIERITRQLPKERQTLLFSATMPEPIKRLVRQYQRDAIHVKTHTHVEHHLLPQFFYRVDDAGKYSLLVHLLRKEDPKLAIVFCATKHGAKSLARNLKGQRLDAEAMHGNLSQAQRDRVIADFKTGRIHVLVATDVAARGLDVKHVTHVFNYDVPKVPDDYIHRIGRTARAGAAGKAITLVDPEDNASWRDILRLPHVTALERKTEGVEQLVYKKHDRGPRPQGRQGGRPGGTWQSGERSAAPRQQHGTHSRREGERTSRHGEARSDAPRFGHSGSRRFSRR